MNDVLRDPVRTALDRLAARAPTPGDAPTLHAGGPDRHRWLLAAAVILVVAVGVAGLVIARPGHDPEPGAPTITPTPVPTVVATTAGPPPGRVLHLLSSSAQSATDPFPIPFTGRAALRVTVTGDDAGIEQTCARFTAGWNVIGGRLRIHLPEVEPDEGCDPNDASIDERVRRFLRSEPAITETPGGIELAGHIEDGIDAGMVLAEPDLRLDGRRYEFTALTGIERLPNDGLAIRIDGVFLDVPTACNALSGGFRQAGGRWFVDGLGAPEIGCEPARARQQQHLEELLRNDPSVVVDADHLRMRGALDDGTVVTADLAAVGAVTTTSPPTPVTSSTSTATTVSATPQRTLHFLDGRLFGPVFPERGYSFFSPSSRLVLVFTGGTVLLEQTCATFTAAGGVDGGRLRLALPDVQPRAGCSQDDAGNDARARELLGSAPSVTEIPGGIELSGRVDGFEARMTLAEPDPRFDGLRFRFTSLAGIDRLPDDGLEIRVDGVSLVVPTACTTLFGSFRSAGGRWLIEGMGADAVGCEPARSRQQDELVQFLRNDPSVVSDGDRLRMTGSLDDGTVVTAELVDAGPVPTLPSRPPGTVVATFTTAAR